MSKGFFPPRPESRPTIYAYEDTNPQYAGLLKAVSYTHLRAHETELHLVCRLLLEKKNFFNDTATTEIYT